MSNFWFIKIILLLWLIGYNNCLKLLDSSIENTWFVIEIDDKFFNYIYYIIWLKITLCIIAWINCIGEIKLVISAIINCLDIAKINYILSTVFSKNNVLGISFSQLLLDRRSVFTVSSYVQVSNITICRINAKCIFINKTAYICIIKVWVARIWVARVWVARVWVTRVWVLKAWIAETWVDKNRIIGVRVVENRITRV